MGLGASFFYGVAQSRVVFVKKYSILLSCLFPGSLARRSGFSGSRFLVFSVSVSELPAS